MNKNIIRFYSAMECFLDDDRVAAHAIVYFCNVSAPASDIYRDLLACKFYKWVDELESITDTQNGKALKEWCAQKQSELDVLGGPFWSQGDNKTIEKEAWKI